MEGKERQGRMGRMREEVERYRIMGVCWRSTQAAIVTAKRKEAWNMKGRGRGRIKEK